MNGSILLPFSFVAPVHEATPMIILSFLSFLFFSDPAAQRNLASDPCSLSSTHAQSAETASPETAAAVASYAIYSDHQFPILLHHVSGKKRQLSFSSPLSHCCTHTCQTRVIHIALPPSPTHWKHRVDLYFCSYFPSRATSTIPTSPIHPIS